MTRDVLAGARKFRKAGGHLAQYIGVVAGAEELVQRLVDRLETRSREQRATQVDARIFVAFGRTHDIPLLQKPPVLQVVDCTAPEPVIGIRGLFCKRTISPQSASRDQRNVGAGELVAQSPSDRCDDRFGVLGDIGQFVDAVEKNNNPLLVEPPQNSQQRDIGGRQSLPGGEHHHVQIGRFEAAARDLVTHEKRIVRARSVGHSNRMVEGAHRQVDVCRLRDVGITANRWVCAVGTGEIALAYVLSHDVRRQRRKAMASTQQI